MDAVAEVFGRYGQGVAIEEPIVSSADGERVQVEADRPVLVKTYLHQDEKAEERRRHLEEAVWHLGRLRQVEPLRVRSLQESDWAEAWKKHFFVHRVGGRIVIVPSWRRHKAAEGEIVIRLDPGMAFGTGLHPTTRLCLSALGGLETRLRGGQAVLDLGTGSGILAMAAAKLGARRVLALDVDAAAARVAAENVARNKLQSVVDVQHGTLREGRPVVQDDTWSGTTFDLILANISFRVLSDLRQSLRRALRPGGLALLSGVLEEDAPRLEDLLIADGWRVVDRQCEADWALLAAAPR